ncbi:MAG: hypothetical protein QM775_24480 [Pirellulales bacterium]
MSYYFQGVDYPSSAARDAAERKFQLDRARQSVDALEREFRRQQERILETERELAEVRAADGRRQALFAKLDSQVADLGRTQSRMQRAQEQLESGMCAVEASVAELSEEQCRQRREVERRFKEVEQEMATGFADAERRRQAGERRLRQEIQDLNDKVEAERQAKLQQARDDAHRAELMINEAETSLASSEPGVAAVELEGPASSVRRAIAAARNLLSRGRPNDALLTAETAYREAEGLAEQEAHRSARLRSQQAYVVGKVQDLNERLQDERMIKYFNREQAAIVAELAVLRRDAERSYQQYGRLGADANGHEGRLDTLNTRVLDLETEAPAAQERYAYREQRTGRLLHLLHEVCGPLAEKVKPSFADPNDLSSDRIVDCRFSVGKVRLRVPIEPTQAFSVDVHGLSSNSECAAIQRKLTAKLHGTHFEEHSEFTDALPQAPRVMSRPAEQPQTRTQERKA